MAWPSFGTNRDYRANERRVRANSMTLEVLKEQGLSEDEAIQYLLHPVEKYSPLALAAYLAGKKEREFLADIPDKLRKGARLAYQMAQRMCPKCHGNLEMYEDDGITMFRCGEGGHVQLSGSTQSFDLRYFPKRDVPSR